MTGVYVLDLAKLQRQAGLNSKRLTLPNYFFPSHAHKYLCWFSKIIITNECTPMIQCEYESFSRTISVRLQGTNIWICINCLCTNKMWYHIWCFWIYIMLKEWCIFSCTSSVILCTVLLQTSRWMNWHRSLFHIYWFIRLQIRLQATIRIHNF